MSSAQVHGSHWPGELREEFFKKEHDVVHISAKALKIVWGNDSRFWQWLKISRHESCFKVGAELIQVNWMEVKGLLDLHKYPLKLHKTYEVVYLIKFKADAFGWHSAPITFELSTADGKKNTSEILDHYKKDDHLWHEICGGEFNLGSSNSLGKIEFSMKEVKTDWWKGGIIIGGVIIRPKQA
ncbi:hypothetical protein HPP92_027596 [Vanilla planifolia]|uniref:Uncharacterized protein n=1 Tax=Vanilla planifolia TaxID=51239 RepID=A0A835P8C9_VANPL|nr:hypothetical protein HPP92_027596 [Vanilla planifolia]